MAKNKIILMVGPLPPQIGGIEFFLEALLRSKLCQLWPVRHFDISKPKSRKRSHFNSPMGYARSFKRNLLTTLISFSYSFYYFLKYLTIIPSAQIALVHLHSSSYMSFWEKCIYADIAKLFKKKVVLHIHGSSFDRFVNESNRLLRSLILWHLRHCDCVIALSESWYRFFRNFLPQEKLAIVENGIDTTFYAAGEAEKTKHPSVLFLGEVCHRKGIYDLIPALAQVFRQIPNLQCIIVGPGELEKAQRLAQTLQVNGLFHFTGPLQGDEKRNWLKRAWLLVLPSYAEVLPIVILEAFASGLPVIATDVGGIPDLVKNGENGLLIKPGDQKALRDAICLLVSDDCLRQRMGMQNQSIARQKYDINVCADKISAIYHRLLR